VNPSTVLWDVDTQIDFLSPQGKLYVPGAEQIVANLMRLTSWAEQRRVLIVSSTCAHMADDAEFKLYPPHCIAGTPGQKKIAETQLGKQFVVPNRALRLPAELSHYQQVIVEKQSFDVFTNPNSEELLARLGKPDVVLYGVVTEICVASAARGLLSRGYKVKVVQDAIRYLDEARGRAALQEIEDGGGRLIFAEQVLSQPTC
jgi:nicotinamidase/pyrazinamidase